MDISISAQRIHGISNQFLLDKPVFNNVVQKFLDFVKDDTLIIHNADFDISFINKEMQNCGFKKMKNSVIDTIKLAKKEFPGQTVNLDSLCRKLNVINTRQDYHGALLDATLLSKVYLRLTTGKQEMLNFINNKSKMTYNIQENINFKRKFLVPRKELMQISEIDRTHHEEFINGMKDSLWKKI